VFLVSMVLFLGSGCLQVQTPDGALVCSMVPGRACPHGYYCAPDNTCWHDGHPFVQFDMSIPAMLDMSSAD
jgi:hypothetical protein